MNSVKSVSALVAALATAGASVGSTQVVFATGCDLTPVGQVFPERREQNGSNLDSWAGVSGRVRRGSLAMNAPGCNYDSGNNSNNTVHLRRPASVSNEVQIEIGFSQRLNADGRRFFRTFTEHQTPSSTVKHDWRDATYDGSASTYGIAPCTQDVNFFHYTGFKIRDAGAYQGTSDHDWNLYMDCETGFGFQYVDHFVTHFKTGRAMTEYELKKSGVQESAEFRDLVAMDPNSNWSNWPNMYCSPTPQWNPAMSTRPLKITGYQWTMSTSGQLC